MSLRWRIAIGLAVIAALVCALGAATAYVTTRNRLESAVDDSLLAGARAAELRPGNRPGGPVGGVTVFGGCPPPGFIGGSAAQVVDQEGVKTPCFVGSLTLPYNASDRRLEVGEAGLRSVSIDGSEYRLLTLPRTDGSVFQVARS